MRAIAIHANGNTEEITIPNTFDEAELYIANLYGWYSVWSSFNYDLGIVVFYDDGFYISHGTPDDYAKEENKFASMLVGGGHKYYQTVVVCKFDKDTEELSEMAELDRDRIKNAFEFYRLTINN